MGEFADEDPSLLCIVISHPHQDHYGLASRVPAGTTSLMGAAAERILAATADFTPSGGRFKDVMHLEDRRTIELGPFRITSFLMDHSAYDALSENRGHTAQPAGRVWFAMPIHNTVVRLS